MSEPAVFNAAAGKTLAEVNAIVDQRGGEYADSWHVDNLVTTFVDATLRRFGIALEPQQKRLLIMAALVDVKDSRMVGPFKRDSIVDGIAYRAAYASLAEDLDKKADTATE